MRTSRLRFANVLRCRIDQLRLCVFPIGLGIAHRRNALSWVLKELVVIVLAFLFILIFPFVLG